MKVRVVKQLCGHMFDIGAVVTVVEVDILSGGFLEYLCTDGEQSWFLHEMEVEGA